MLELVLVPLMAAGAVIDVADVQGLPPGVGRKSVAAPFSFNPPIGEVGGTTVAVPDMNSNPTPIVGAVGMLQFDVMQFRLENEYGAPVRFERIPFRYPRWVTGSESDIDRVASGRGRMRLYDSKGNPMILFEDEWNMRWAMQNESRVQWHTVAP